MREVIAGKLWLGNARDGRDPRELLDLEIEAVVDLAYEEPPAVLPRGMIYCRIPLVDGGGNDQRMLHLAILATTELIRREIETLVVCGAGMSRSPSVVAASLAIIENTSPESCLQRVTAGTSHEVAPNFWADVRGIYDRIVADG